MHRRRAACRWRRSGATDKGGTAWLAGSEAAAFCRHGMSPCGRSTPTTVALPYMEPDFQLGYCVGTSPYHHHLPGHCGLQVAQLRAAPHLRQGAGVPPVHRALHHLRGALCGRRLRGGHPGESRTPMYDEQSCPSCYSSTQPHARTSAPKHARADAPHLTPYQLQHHTAAVRRACTTRPAAWPWSRSLPCCSCTGCTSWCWSACSWCRWARGPTSTPSGTSWTSPHT